MQAISQDFSLRLSLSFLLFFVSQHFFRKINKQKQSSLRLILCTRSYYYSLQYGPSVDRDRGVAGQGPRVELVCERFLENKVYAAQSAAGREAPLRPAGGLGGHCKPPSGVRGSARKYFEDPENLTHKKQCCSDIF